MAPPPPAPSSTAFFYGTLISPAVLQRVTARPSTHVVTRPALLPDYRRRRVKFADYPAVTPAPGATVRGTYVEGLTVQDFWRLDLFEGDQYERRAVKVRLVKRQGEGTRGAQTAWVDGGMGPDAKELKEEELEEKEVETVTYVWKEPEHYLEQREWDFGEFVREKLWRWAGTDADEEGEFEDVDKAVEEQQSHGQDPTGGRAVGGAFEQRVSDA